MGWEIVPTPDQFRAQIAQAEALADAIHRVLPLFIPTQTSTAYGREECEVRLLGVRDAIRNYLCADPELWLKELENTPLPSPEQIKAMREKAMQGPVLNCAKHGELGPADITCLRCIQEQMNPGPTVEQLMQASQQVQLFENALAKLDELPEGMSDMADSLMRPQIEIQLEAAKSYLSRMQAAMERSQPPVQSIGEAPLPE